MVKKQKTGEMLQKGMRVNRHNKFGNGVRKAEKISTPDMLLQERLLNKCRHTRSFCWWLPLQGLLQLLGKYSLQSMQTHLYKLFFYIREIQRDSNK